MIRYVLSEQNNMSTWYLSMSGLWWWSCLEWSRIVFTIFGNEAVNIKWENEYHAFWLSCLENTLTSRRIFNSLSKDNSADWNAWLIEIHRKDPLSIISVIFVSPSMYSLRWNSHTQFTEAESFDLCISLKFLIILRNVLTLRWWRMIFTLNGCNW